MNIRLKNWRGLRAVFLMMPFFLIFSVLNPLVSRWGKTVLFYVFSDTEKPFTLESLCYGLSMSFTLLTVSLYFFGFSRILTAEKMQYLFSNAFPNFSIITVMIFRFLPQFSKRCAEISDARRGLFPEKNTTLKEKLNFQKDVLLAAVSSALEDGKISAVCMEERSWGRHKRTSYMHYEFSLTDAALLLILFFSAFFIAFAAADGFSGMKFYPEIEFKNPLTNALSCAGFFSALCVSMISACFFER